MMLAPSDAKVQMRPYLQSGFPAPEFTAEGLEGEQIDLSAAAAQSKFVLLDFWASWCGPCRREYPYLRRLHAQYKDHGLTIIGVNLDDVKDKAVEAAKSELLAYPHAFDGKGWKNEVAVLYRVHSIPQTFLLDRELKIVARGLRGEGLERLLRAKLGPGDIEAAKAVESASASPSEPSAP